MIVCGDFSSCVTLYVCFLAISLPFSASRYFAVTEDSVLADFVLTANELGIIVAIIANDSPAEVIRFMIDIVSLLHSISVK